LHSAEIIAALDEVIGFLRAGMLPPKERCERLATIAGHARDRIVATRAKFDTRDREKAKSRDIADVYKVEKKGPMWPTK
jgi:hypothetical protein